MKIKAVLFDMDGLMFDTERLSDTVWLAVAPRFGLTLTPEDMNLLRGRNREGGKAEYIKKYGADVPFDAMYEAVMADFSARLEQQVPLRPGLLELVHTLNERGLLRAVVSSTHKALVQRHLEVAGLADDFRTLVCGDMVQNSKPAPDIYLLAAQTLGVLPEECIVLEDSYNGVRAGAAAGCRTIMVPDTQPVTPEMEQLAYAVVPSLADVPALL